jgi:hypothetical protein
MEEGFILDRGHGYMYVTSWIAGQGCSTLFIESVKQQYPAN